MACYVLYTLTFYLQLLGVGRECQPVALLRKTGGSCGARPPLPSDAVSNSQNSWDELRVLRMWLVADTT